MKFCKRSQSKRMHCKWCKEHRNKWQWPSTPGPKPYSPSSKTWLTSWSSSGRTRKTLSCGSMISGKISTGLWTGTITPSETTAQIWTINCVAQIAANALGAGLPTLPTSGQIVMQPAGVRLEDNCWYRTLIGSWDSKWSRTTSGSMMAAMKSKTTSASIQLLSTKDKLSTSVRTLTLRLVLGMGLRGSAFGSQSTVSTRPMAPLLSSMRTIKRR